jgi:uncharacterized protein (TIGR03000 family)
MSRLLRCLAKATLVAAGLLFATTGPALAQRHGGGGHGGGRGGRVRGAVVHGGGVRGGVVRGSVVRGGFRGGVVRGGGFRGGVGFRGGGWGGGWGGWGWGWGIPWYGYGGYPYYGYSYPYYGFPYFSDPYDASFYTPDSSMVEPNAQNYLAPGTGTYSYYPPAIANADSNIARVEVRVPPDAELWFDGTKMTQVGPLRTFTTPPLTPGRTFTYEVRASWMANGVPVTQTRQITVEAGKRATVDFLAGGPGL